MFDPNLFSGRVVSIDVVKQAQSLNKQGKVQEAWELLAAAGDEYAGKAAEIVGPSQSIYKDVVDTIWERNVPDADI